MRELRVASNHVTQDSKFPFLLTELAPANGRAQSCFQCCGSGMFIPDPGSRILIFTHPGSRIPDLGSRISDPGSRIQKQQQKREVKKTLVVIPFNVATNSTKL
jgi:hypothetical protein